MSEDLIRLNAALEGRYRVDGTLGEGGMATVYHAYDPKHDRRVALKVFKPPIAEAVGADRFSSEIKTTARLQHPHILPLFDSGQAGDFLFYVMPLVDGESLRDRLNRERRLPVGEALHVAQCVAQALDYSHRQGIVHRDVKPANILIHDGQPVVADFGIALAADATDVARLTQTGLSLGTPFYMSPEQASGENAIGPPSDVYALGCVLYETLTGSPPHTGGSAQAVLGKILTADVEQVRTRRSSVPEHVDAALARALERLPADRFATARDFAAALADPSFRYGAPGRAEAGIRRGTRWLPAVVMALLVLIAAGWFLSRESVPGIVVDRGLSLAVLPFENLSTQDDDQIWTDGFHEELIARLSRVPELKVISRTSVMGYRDRTQGVRGIAARLGVEHLVEGSVRWAGETVRITVALVDAETESNTWSQTFDERVTLDDLFRVQSDVATRIVSEVRGEFAGDIEARVSSRPTESFEAYRAFQIGRFHFNTRSREGFTRAIDYYRRAIAEDPSFALARVGLADVQSMLVYYGWLPTLPTLSEAQQSARTALELEPDLGEAHTSLAEAVWYGNWDWDAARDAFELGLSASPGYAQGHQWYSYYLVARRDFTRALAESEAALTLDPLALIVNTWRGVVLRHAGDPEAAIEQFLGTLEIEEDFALGRAYLGFTYATLGRHELAITQLERARELDLEATRILGMLGYAYAVSGRREEALRVAGQLEALAENRHVSSYDRALVRVGLDERDRAFQLLSHAVTERDPLMLLIDVEPAFVPWSEDPRFVELRAAVGLPPGSR